MLPLFVIAPSSLEPHTIAREHAISALLAERNADGYWVGELSSSALATATAVCALAVFVRGSATDHPEAARAIADGVRWLSGHANADGGWGDTDRSISNISTTTLVWAALGMAGADAPTACVCAAEEWLRTRAGSLEPASLARTIASRYGKDRTFSIPILTMCAIAGRFGSGKTAWSHVSQLPFELAALPSRWFGAIRLPVVSYALPALIAIGQVRHHFRPTRNPILRLLRAITRRRTLRVLESIQPVNGGFLEATPLTSFVTMSLAAIGLTEHAVTRRGVDFLLKSARADGSWAIDSNLATWVTTLAVNALPVDDERFSVAARKRVREWLLAQQYRCRHPYTNAAPGGWAWTDLPGGVPDADDTAGALLALLRLGPPDDVTHSAAAVGVRWLLDLQNSDGGIPTFCKGWGALPFDRSSPDITAHALRAWVAWMDEWNRPDASLQDAASTTELRAIDRALRFLAAKQRPDGSWIPLWFGHQESPDDENPIYGTTRVLLALCELSGRPEWPLVPVMASRARQWLIKNRNADGGWAGVPGATSSVEETALAVEALSGGEEQDGETAEAIAGGMQWLATRIENGEWRGPSPIGFYFARLWYYERLYPLIFTVAALSRSLAPSGFVVE